MLLATPPWFKPPPPERLSKPIGCCQEPLQMSKLQSRNKIAPAEMAL